MDDLIASLYPFQRSYYAEKAIGDPANSPPDCPRLVRQSLVAQDRLSNETSDPPSDEDDENYQHQRVVQGLELKFSHKLKGGGGIVLGTNRKRCDIILPQILNDEGRNVISDQHCRITFDTQRRLVVQDCSSGGSIVTYDNEARERRCNFPWIIGNDKELEDIDEIVLEIHPLLKFQIIVSKAYQHADAYFNKVTQFKEIATDDEMLFRTLRIESVAPTAAPTGRHTANQRPILLKRKELGRGSFGIVSRVWDVSNGLVYASKKPYGSKSFDWRKEAEILHNITHEHIVKLHFTLEAPSPQLVLEYLRLGNLHDQHRREPISERDVETLLYQCSLALSYLHGQKPSIVHRDIKSENILVLSRTPFHVKISDFGFAKAGNYLDTHCGTPYYAAPEIAQRPYSHSGGSLRYTSAVDIWSLGLLVFECRYGCPKVAAKPGTLAWSKQVVEKLRALEPDSLLYILMGMLVIDPNERYSAEQCLEGVKKLEGSQTPTPMSSETQPRELEPSGPTALNPTSLRQDNRHVHDAEIQQYRKSESPQHPSQPDSKGKIRQQESAIEDSEIPGGARSTAAEAAVHNFAPSMANNLKRNRSTETSFPPAKRTKCTAAEGSWGHAQCEEPSSPHDSQSDANSVGHGEQNDSVGGDAPGAKARGSSNVRRQPNSSD